MKKRWKVLSLLLIFLLMGCASRQSAEEAFPVPTETAGEPSKSADSGTTLVSSEAQGETTERLVVKRAEMRVSVADPAEAMRTVVQWAESMQGYVVNSNQWNSTNNGQTYICASVMVRVPAERLDEMMQKVRDLAADPKTGVLSETVTGEDVTAEYVDSQARLRNLKAAEAQLVELLDQAPDLEYTLDIFRELTEIRSQIEVLEGRIKYLEESAALSALSVEFVAEASLQPLQIGPWKPAGVAKEAIQTLVKVAQDVGTALIKFVIIWVPFLLPIGLIVYFVRKGAKKRKAARAAQAAQVQLSDTPKD
ncbi:MAG TPA: DUF4349 domain-containing protein [Anaerolineaceae bacterium]|nr:DUF4349 domain-containing protein [Anaerolineaceae bacterium]HPK27138.1 DUF4349 domain-containing protein [Anaerolineaceae bacterium]